LARSQGSRQPLRPWGWASSGDQQANHFLVERSGKLISTVLPGHWHQIVMPPPIGLTTVWTIEPLK
jgi:hypothetical protein